MFKRRSSTSGRTPEIARARRFSGGHPVPPALIKPSTYISDGHIHAKRIDRPRIDSGQAKCIKS